MNAESPQDPRVLDMYKLTVEMADRVSARRAGANAYFISVQGALVAAMGFLSSRTPPVQDRYLAAIAGVGIITALTWFLLLRSYRDLNRAKFAVINAIEAQLPIQPFADEWDQLKRDPIPQWRRRYAELGTVERVVPALFALVNTFLAVSVIWS
jgi:hypothetical protein